MLSRPENCVCVDAHNYFFSAGIDVRGNLQQSLLRTTYNAVTVGIVQAHLNVPYAELLGQDSGESSYSQKAESTGGWALMETHTLRHVPVAIKKILQGARSKYPALTMAELMAAYTLPLQYAQIKLGPSGSCLDYLCFGSCKNSPCSYKHMANASIATARAEAIAPKLGAAFTAYDANQAGDLAFYADVLGKANSSGYWCHLCQLSWAQWNECANEEATKWTIDEFKKALHTKIKTKADSIMGVKEEMHYKGISPQLYV
jgi:hypothetical protein